jgi:hypothetical protein
VKDSFNDMSRAVLHNFSRRLALTPAMFMLWRCLDRASIFHMYVQSSLFKIKAYALNSNKLSTLGIDTTDRWSFSLLLLL